MSGRSRNNGSFWPAFAAVWHFLGAILVGCCVSRDTVGPRGTDVLSRHTNQQALLPTISPCGECDTSAWNCSSTQIGYYAPAPLRGCRPESVSLQRSSMFPTLRTRPRGCAEHSTEGANALEHEEVSCLCQVPRGKQLNARATTPNPQIRT